jgi:hypothetical protein
MMIDQYPANQKSANIIKKMPLPPPKTNSIRDIPVFRRTRRAGNIPARLPQILTTIFKKSESKVAGNIGPAVRNTIPGIGTGNPGSILSGCVVSRVSDDFAVRDILFEHLGRKLECECQVLYDERELRRRLLRGNSALILRAGRSDWWIEAELQNRFQGQCEMEFGILGSDDGLPGFSGWERIWGYGQGPSNLFIDKWIRAS